MQDYQASVSRVLLRQVFPWEGVTSLNHAHKVSRYTTILTLGLYGQLVGGHSKNSFYRTEHQVASRLEVSPRRVF
jgi:hypothetical protein